MPEELQLIDIAFLIKDKAVSEGLGRGLWAASKEVEAFYNHDRERARFRRLYLSESVPEGASSWPLVGRLFGLYEWLTNAEKVEHEQAITLDPGSDWASAKGTFTRTYAASKIVELTRRLAGQQIGSERLVVVTDLVLTPPKDWRYIIWDTPMGRDVVISLAPLDPRYWGMPEDDRGAMIKHRARVAMLSAVGSALGLERCENDQCFLYASVDSVVNLDRMVVMGPEHELSELQGRGFAVRVPDPTEVHTLVLDPAPDTEAWAGA